MTAGLHPPIISSIHRLSIPLLVFSATIGGALPARLDAGVKQPHLLVILADELAPDDLALEPLKQVAAEGLTFQRCYTNPRVTSAIAGLITGKDAYQSRITAERGDHSRLPAYAHTLGEVMAEAGYETAWLGRWPLGANAPHHPTSQGFATFSGWTGLEETEGFRESSTAALETEAGAEIDLDAATARATAAFLKSPREKPFLAVAAFAKEETFATHLAAILAALRESGLGPDTLLWITGTRGRPSENLHGPRGSMHEAGLRVPCVVRWPGQVPRGGEMRRIVSHLDLMPTLAEAAGVSLPTPGLFEGGSLLPALRAGGAPPAWPNRQVFQVRPGQPVNALESSGVAVHTDRWLAVRDPGARRAEPKGGGAWELYDIPSDPLQRYDLSGEYGYVLGHLRADYGHWFSVNSAHAFAPTPTELGHEGWPVVRLTTPDAAQPSPGEWLWIVAPLHAGRWRASLAFPPAMEPPSGEAELQTDSIRLAAALDGRHELDLGELMMEKGSVSILLKIKPSSPSSPPSGWPPFRLLLSESR